jgi:hypothetical protein
VATIRIADEDLLDLVPPTTSIGDGSREAELALVTCRHLLPWRSLPVELALDALTRRRLRILSWLLRSFVAFAVVYPVGIVVSFVLGLRELARLEPGDADGLQAFNLWMSGLGALGSVVLVVAVGIAIWLIAVRRIPLCARTRDGIRIHNVHPEAAREWVVRNRPGAVVVADWQGAWSGPAVAR